MKRKDLYLVAFVAATSALISAFVSNAIFSSPKNRQEKVPVVSPITSEFPDTTRQEYTLFFNKGALNPTQLIKIGDNNNQKPFNTKQ